MTLVAGMKRLPLATAVLALALPGTALAAGASHGVVLSVERAHHLVRVVDARHRVHDYTYRGALRGLHAGSAVTFLARHGRITRLERVRSGSRSVSFYARVVHSNKRGVVLVLADGHRVSFTGHQVDSRHGTLAAADGSPRSHRHDAVAHMASSALPVSVDIQGLEPGVTVLVNETVERTGTVTVTITVADAVDDHSTHGGSDGGPS